MLIYVVYFDWGFDEIVLLTIKEKPVEKRAGLSLLNYGNERDIGPNGGSAGPV